MSTDAPKPAVAVHWDPIFSLAPENFTGLPLSTLLYLLTRNQSPEAIKAGYSIGFPYCGLHVRIQINP